MFTFQFPHEFPMDAKVCDPTYLKIVAKYYGTSLKETANIIVKKLRFLKRLFDNLWYSLRIN